MVTHGVYTLLQEIKRTGPENAFSMLVDPLMPQAWRTELGRKNLLQASDSADRYSVATAERRMQQASKGGGRQDFER